MSDPSHPYISARPDLGRYLGDDHAPLGILNTPGLGAGRAASLTALDLEKAIQAVARSFQGYYGLAGGSTYGPGWPD